VAAPRAHTASIALFCIAILLDALAYRKLSGNVQVSTKGIVLSLLCGVGMGLFYPFVAKTLKGDGHLDHAQWRGCLRRVYSSTTSPQLHFHATPGERPPGHFSRLFRRHRSPPLPGVPGGAIWGVGTLSNFVASYAQLVGPATFYALGQGATMISPFAVCSCGRNSVVPVLR
jgi:glucose uptake protein